MTGSELVAALADRSVLEQVQRLLGLPSDRVADRLEELAAAQARTDATVKELAGEVKELAAAQARTDATVKELAAEVKGLAAEVKGLARVGKETRQALGALSDNVGFGLEELGALVLPDLLLEQRGVRVSGFKRRFVSTTAGEEELDLFAEGDRDGETVVVIGEVKSRIYRADVERFARRLERLQGEFIHPVVPLLFGFMVHPSASECARRLDVLVVATRPSSAAA